MVKRGAKREEEGAFPWRHCLALIAIAAEPFRRGESHSKPQWEEEEEMA